MLLYYKIQFLFGQKIVKGGHQFALKGVVASIKNMSVVDHQKDGSLKVAVNNRHSNSYVPLYIQLSDGSIYEARGPFTDEGDVWIYIPYKYSSLSSAPTWIEEL